LGARLRRPLGDGFAVCGRLRHPWGATQDAERQPGAPARVRDRDRKRERVAGAAAQDAVQEQVVERPAGVDGREARGGRLGADRELLARRAAAGDEQLGRELVEVPGRPLGRHGVELGGQGKRQPGMDGAGVGDLLHEGRQGAHRGH
jgi:hypothetical protein